MCLLSRRTSPPKTDKTRGAPPARGFLQSLSDGGRPGAAPGSTAQKSQSENKSRGKCAASEATSLGGNANCRYLANAGEAQEGNIKLLFLITFTSLSSHFPPVKDVSLGQTWQSHFSPKTLLVFPLMAIINFVF